MLDRRAIAAIVIVVSGVTAGAYLMRGGTNNANHPEGVTMICGACGHAWPMTVRQISDHHVARYGEPMTCPRCAAAAGVAAGRAGDGPWVKQNEVNPYTEPPTAPNPNTQ